WKIEPLESWPSNWISFWPHGFSLRFARQACIHFLPKPFRSRFSPCCCSLTLCLRRPCARETNGNERISFISFFTARCFAESAAHFFRTICGSAHRLSFLLRSRPFCDFIHGLRCRRWRRGCARCNDGRRRCCCSRLSYSWSRCNCWERGKPWNLQASGC